MQATVVWETPQVVLTTSLMRSTWHRPGATTHCDPTGCSGNLFQKHLWAANPDHPASPVSSHAPLPTNPVTVSPNLGKWRQLLAILEFHRWKDKKSCGESGHPKEPQSSLFSRKFDILLIPDNLALCYHPLNNQHQIDQTSFIFRVTRRWNILPEVTTSVNSI